MSVVFQAHTLGMTYFEHILLTIRRQRFFFQIQVYLINLCNFISANFCFIFNVTTLTEPFNMWLKSNMLFLQDRYDLKCIYVFSFLLPITGTDHII